MLLMRIMRLL